jgi:hypothetical protein
MTLIADLEAFILSQRPHGPQTADATPCLEWLSTEGGLYVWRGIRTVGDIRGC